jgi:hypothetical protein
MNLAKILGLRSRIKQLKEAAEMDFGMDTLNVNSLFRRYGLHTPEALLRESQEGYLHMKEAREGKRRRESMPPILRGLGETNTISI